MSNDALSASNVVTTLFCEFSVYTADPALPLLVNVNVPVFVIAPVCVTVPSVLKPMSLVPPSTAVIAKPVSSRKPKLPPSPPVTSNVVTALFCVSNVYVPPPANVNVVAVIPAALCVIVPVLDNVTAFAPASKPATSKPPVLSVKLTAPNVFVSPSNVVTLFACVKVNAPPPVALNKVNVPVFVIAPLCVTVPSVLNDTVFVFALTPVIAKPESSRKLKSPPIAASSTSNVVTALFCEPRLKVPPPFSVSVSAVIVPDCKTVPPVVTVTSFAPALALSERMVIPPELKLERVILPVPVVAATAFVIAPVPPVVTFN